MVRKRPKRPKSTAHGGEGALVCMGCALACLRLGWALAWRLWRGFFLCCSCACLVLRCVVLLLWFSASLARVVFWPSSVGFSPRISQVVLWFEGIHRAHKNPHGVVMNSSTGLRLLPWQPVVSMARTARETSRTRTSRAPAIGKLIRMTWSSMVQLWWPPRRILRSVVVVHLRHHRSWCWRWWWSALHRAAPPSKFGAGVGDDPCMAGLIIESIVNWRRKCQIGHFECTFPIDADNDRFPIYAIVAELADCGCDWHESDIFGTLLCTFWCLWQWQWEWHTQRSPSNNRWRPGLAGVSEGVMTPRKKVCYNWCGLFCWQSLHVHTVADSVQSIEH